MPFVPLTGSKARDYAFKQITYSKGAGNRPWTEIVVDGFRTRTLMGATRVAANGPRVMMPFGLWAPSRPYIRTALASTISGGPELLGNAARIEDCTIIRHRSGYPYSDPTGSSALPSIGPTQTGGLCSNSGVPVLSPDLANRLIAECMQKVGDRKISLGESLAEGRKTIDHIAKTSMQVLNAYKALRRGNIPQALKSLRLSKSTLLNGKTMSERWLELQYGWYPLLADIFATADILQHGVQRKKYLVSAVRQISESGPYKNGNVTGTVALTHRCKLVYSVSSQDLDVLSRFGFINPAEVAWAVMPYSFVIDWFLPIGGLLEAYSATMGLSFIDGHITSRAQTRAKGVINNPLNLHYLNSSRFQIALDYFGMKRSVVLSATPLPYTKSPFSSTHLLSAIALLRQLR